MASNTSTTGNNNEAAREGIRIRLVIVIVTVRGLSASLSHSSGTHEEIIRTFSFPNPAAANVPIDDEESLRPPPPPPPPPDVPIEVIEGLLNKVEIIDDGDICTIRMDELKVNDEARAIGHCSHTFHLDCVAEWVKRKPTCPLCRFEIPINGEGDDDQGVKRRRLV